MNISRCIVLLLVCSFYVQNSHENYNILAIMPYNGKSHFYFAQVLFEALAQRGNNVTVLSHFPRKAPLQNYHDISMGRKEETGINKFDMEDILSRYSLSLMMELFESGVEQVCRQGLSHPNVQKLLTSKDHYDVVITEMFNADCFLGFAYKFDASLVLLRSSTLAVWLNDRTGNPDNPSFVPGSTTGNPGRMNFLERLYNTVSYFVLKLIYWYYDQQCDSIAKEHFGLDMPSLQNIGRNASFYLVNTHFTYQYMRPLLPNAKEIAGMHIRDTKPLPSDLENWISGASHGLIYFNLGSMLKTSSMAKDKRLLLLKSFSQLPHRVLMKWETEESMAGLPDNVKLTTWSPQNDILHHRNVKLFITHAGMLGTVEAVHAGVPMIVIPFYGDQLTNAVLLQEKRVAILVQWADITFDIFNKTLHDVLYDPGYTERAKELSSMFRNRPVSPLMEAVHWVEFVARHKGKVKESVLRTPILELSVYQYLLLDVLGLLLLGVFIVCSTIWLTMKLMCKPTDKGKYKRN